MFENVRSTRVGLSFAQLGTFWTRSFGDKKQIRRLVNLVHQTSSLQQFESTSNNLAGNPKESARVSNVVVKFDVQDIIQGGDQFYDEVGRYYGTLDDYPGVYGGGNTQFFILPVSDIVPVAIQSSTGKLLVGVDFFVYKDAWIFFRADPRISFAEGSYLVTEGYRTTNPSLLSFPLQTVIQGPTKYVIDYARNSQSPKSLELALASVAGLAITQYDEVLLDVRVEGDHLVYSFDSEVIRVDYQHEHLAVGQRYAKDTIIGDAVGVFSNAIPVPEWWRTVDWRGGLSLDPIVSRHKGLTVKDTNTTAYAAGEDGLGVHVRMDLTGDQSRETAYWEDVAASETSQGFYLNSLVGLESDNGQFSELVELTSQDNEVSRLLGLPAEPLNLSRLAASKQVNPIDMLFRAGLATRSIVVTIDQTVVKNQQALFNYLAKELPVGVLTIILAYAPILQTDLASIADSVDSATIGAYTAADIHNLGDTFVLQGKLLDSARIIHETT